MMKKVTSRTLVTMALLIALEVILTRFLSINLPIVRIGFGFLPVAVAAILFGPLWAGIGYAVGDLLGMLIWPTGAYFPGFTLTAFLVGVTYGLFLYKKTVTWPRLTVTVCVVILAFSLVLNTIWLSMLYGKAFWGLLPTRVLQCVILIPVQILTIKLVSDKVLPRLGMMPQSGSSAPEKTTAA